MTTPHPAAVSAAKELNDFSASGFVRERSAEIIHRHYAPVLEEKDRRIAELEHDNATLREQLLAQIQKRP